MSPKKNSVSNQRSQLKRRRAQLPKKVQQSNAAAATQLAMSMRQFRTAKNIALYIPVRGELDAEKIYKFCPPSARIYLPVLAPCLSQGLLFVRWCDRTRFNKNRFGIPEPRIDAKLLISKRCLDTVVTPLLGFDRFGHRLGMGGGFYDRSFAFKKRLARGARPALIGFAHQCQEIDPFEPADWDVPLDGIVTEKQAVEINCKT